MFRPEDAAFWSEDEWEAYLNRQERWLTFIMDTLFEFIRKYPLPEGSDTRAMQKWEEALAAYLQRKTGWQGGTNWYMLWMLWEPEEEEDALPTQEEEEPAGCRELACLPIYRQASRLAREVLRWAEQLPAEQKDSSLVQFCTSVNQIGAYLARGHQFGYERETIGGNIVCVRRALNMANLALRTLQEIQQARQLFTGDAYRDIYEAIYEMRNALGLYVQELRERQRLGID